MDWVGSVQSGIDFIEEMLEEPSLTSELVAKHVHVSHAHFSRAFVVLSGMSVSEYIRNRRLTLAGIMLQQHEQSVLEVALQVGYESSEAFSKAFKRFHGVNPSECHGATLKEFWPLQISVSLVQDRPLSFVIEEKSTFWLNGRREFVLAEDAQATSRLWQQCEEDGFLDFCYELPTFRYVVGVYDDELYGIQALCGAGDGVFSRKVPAHKWAVFVCEGELPASIDSTWNRIYSDWVPECQMDLGDLPQLEVYKDTEDGYVCEIWIAIK